jgi:hypothetical protein
VFSYENAVLCNRQPEQTQGTARFVSNKSSSPFAKSRRTPCRGKQLSSILPIRREGPSLNVEPCKTYETNEGEAGSGHKQ